MGGILGSVGSAVIGSDAAGDASDAQISANREAIQAAEAAAGRADAFLAPLAGEDSFGAEALYNLALENANRATLQSGAARGRLSAGDTLEDLSNNVLLNATPLIDRQSQNIASALDFDRAVATTRGNIQIGQGSQIGNLLQNIGNAEAAGEIGQANALIGGIQGITNAGTSALTGGFF